MLSMILEEFDFSPPYQEPQDVIFLFLFSQPTEEEASSKEDSTPSKPVVGIIYPPPEVRNIVDKTASFVAR